jgi:hypothetical protein
VADFEALVRLLARGADSARGEARRVIDELVERGDLGREEAAAIEAAVADAVEANRRWLGERVVGPLRGAARGAAEAVGRALGEAGSAEVLARLDAIEGRLAALERRLGGEGGGRGGAG